MKDNQAKYPQLRFKGFTDPWEERKLGDEVLIVMGQSPNSENYTDNPNDHILVQGNADMKNGHVFPRVWTTQVTKQAEKNDLILSVRAPVGDIGKTDYDVVIGRGVAAIKGNEFIFQNLGKMKSDGYWTRYSTGSTFESINSSDIKEAIISIPRIEEQQKIGSFFKQLDNTIALHQRKLAKLKELKQGYLQKLFPKNGSKFPQLRVSGFADDWEEHKLGDIFDVHTDFVSNGSFQALKENVQLYKTENYAYMIRLQDASNNWNGPWLYTDKQGFDFLDKSTVYKDDILMSDRGTIGKFFLVPQLDKPMTLSSNAVLLRSTKNDNNFIYYMLNTSNISNQIIVRTTPGVQPMISKTEFKKINTCIPNIEEQQKIGSFFKQLDDTIALHQRKLEKLQELKKGYLQKMFC